jgi:hypothetical protein
MKKVAIPVAVLLAVGLVAALCRAVVSFVTDYESRSRAMERSRVDKPEPASQAASNDSGHTVRPSKNQTEPKYSSNAGQASGRGD